MPICPIDTGRYGSPEMRELFEEENRLQRLMDVEVALAESLAELGKIPREAAKRIRKEAVTGVVTPVKVKEREKQTRHDIMAMVEVLAEVCGDDGKYVHWGATSYDIVDTSWALIMKDALAITERRMGALRDVLCDLAVKNRDLVMVGRTHGQHATPITFGFKMAVYAAEAGRNLERMRGVKERLLVGKMSGAVGTMASQGEDALKIESMVMRRLNLRPAEITTQVICRDRLAEFVCWAALTASSLDRISTEIRNLQRTEIMEAAEGFDVRQQVGSSTMPHKQNPIDSEKVSGLAKVMRGLVTPALENVPLWHERDLTDSSSERFLIPLTFIILDEMLLTLVKVLNNLRIFPDNMRRNLGITGGAILSEAVMMALAQSGFGRQRAHEILRGVSAKSAADRISFSEALLRTKEIMENLSKEEILKLTDPENYIGKAREITDRAVAYAKSV
jgi:adenylosuccinate lyase